MLKFTSKLSLHGQRLWWHVHKLQSCNLFKAWPLSMKHFRTQFCKDQVCTKQAKESCEECACI